MNTVRKGKRAELIIMTRLLEHNFNVFQCLADTEGIDCGVLGNNGRFCPIQIKSREEFTRGDIVQIPTRYLKNIKFVAIYDELSTQYWIIPVNQYQKMSRIFKSKDGDEYYRLSYTISNAKKLELYKGEKGIKRLSIKTKGR
ncbi:hypothetical protein ES703_73272 [subsurface metagenome]